MGHGMGVGEKHTSSGYKSPILGAEDYVWLSELDVLDLFTVCLNRIVGCIMYSDVALFSSRRGPTPLLPNSYSAELRQLGAFG